MRSTWRSIITCALLVLLGINLRTVILAVPPILPLIQHDLSLPYTGTGLLTAIPLLVFGGAAWLSGLLTGRVGGRTAVIVGLVLLAAGTLLRAVLPTVFWLYFLTVVLSLGIAIAQTAAPVLSRYWFPKHIGLVVALFTDGLILGETIAAGITLPLMLRFLGPDAWTATFILWGVPVVVMLVLWLWLAPPAPSTTVEAAEAAQALPLTNEAAQETPPGNIAHQGQARVSAWQLGFLLGGGSLIYFGMNGWIATYNQATHHSALTALSLAILNGAQLPASLLVTFFAQQLAGRRWPFIVAGITSIIAIAGWIFAPAGLEPLWAALLGGASALVFALGLALPPLLAAPGRVAHLTGITLSISYSTAFAGPFLGGGFWDLLHIPAVAFLPVALASIALIVLGSLLPPRSHFGPNVFSSTGAKRTDAAVR